MPWPDQLIHVVDFEGSLSSGVLEYGVVSWRGGEIVAARTRRCGATGPVRPEDFAVHGLAERELTGAACLAEDFEYFAGLRETGPLAAHFASAENSLLKSVWAYPRASPDFVRGEGAVVQWGPWVDTGRLYPQLYRTIDSTKLDELIHLFQLQPSLDEVAGRHCPTERCRYHAALYDALACTLLLDRLAREPGVAQRSLAWLLEMSTLNPDKRFELNQGYLF